MRASWILALSFACAAGCTQRRDDPDPEPPSSSEDAVTGTVLPSRPGGRPALRPGSLSPRPRPPEGEPPVQPARESRFVAADDPRLRYEGRFDRRDATAPRCAWTGCALRARVDATAVDLQVMSEAHHPHDYLEVFVDDGPPTRVQLNPGANTVRIAEGLAEGPHDLTVMKRTEPLVGTIVIGGLQLENALEPLVVDERARSFLFIGDSITAGYGNEGQGPGCPFSADTENGARTYAAQTARAFDAELHVTAWSGKGLYRNLDREEPDLMPELYDRMIPRDESSADSFEVPPDLVVVNLGTNDFAGSNPPADEFIQAYVDFARELRALAPDAPIVLASGPMLSDFFPEGLEQRSTLWAHLEAVVAARRAEGDGRVYAVDLGTQGGEGEPLGCDWHPHVETHARMAGTLIEAVEDATGWQAQGPAVGAR